MWANDIAKELKGRDNPTKIGVIIGEVATTLPNIKIKALDGKMILTKEMLYFTSGMINKEYKPKISLKNGNATLTASTTENYKIEGFDVDKEGGTVTLFFELKPGDKVLLIPTTDEQSFFVVDKIEQVE
ncbi:DUF2577 family protein [Filifactor alocis]|uniref:DUF2577 family protein n=1 Tax=Filifactor alocis TaxID=143361 RepID=UPI003F9F87EA